MQEQHYKVCPECYQEFTIDRCVYCDVPLVSPHELELEVVVRSCEGCGGQLVGRDRTCVRCGTVNSILPLPRTPALSCGCVLALLVCAPITIYIIWGVALTVGPARALTLPVAVMLGVLYWLVRAPYPWKRMTVTWDSLTPEERDTARRMRQKARSREQAQL